MNTLYNDANVYCGKICNILRKQIQKIFKVWAMLCAANVADMG